jgi:hypothetical protein
VQIPGLQFISRRHYPGVRGIANWIVPTKLLA